MTRSEILIEKIKLLGEINEYEDFEIDSVLSHIAKVRREHTRLPVGASIKTTLDLNFGNGYVPKGTKGEIISHVQGDVQVGVTFENGVFAYTNFPLIVPVV